MANDLLLRIVLVKPSPGVDFGLQKGAGHHYETLQKQRSGIEDLVFTLTIQVKGDPQKDDKPGFMGAFVQGTPAEKFIYIDIGTAAGQQNSIWARRLKVPLRDISWAMVDQARPNSGSCLETHVAGTAKDGGPNCATVKPFDGWKVGKD